MLGLSIVINYNIIVGFEGHNIFYGSFLLWAFRATVIFNGKILLRAFRATVIL